MSFHEHIIIILAIFYCAASTDTNQPTYFEPKIINGTVAKQENNKHQVSIRLKATDRLFGKGFICGGSLIKPSIVLTAAHCIYNNDLNVMRKANEFVVSMGSMNIFDRINSNAFEVLEVHYKPTFNVTTYIDDLALMFLNGFAPTGVENIAPIEINWNDIPTDGTVCQVTGWGKTEKGTISKILITLDVPILNNERCNINFEGSIHNGMICAGYMEGLKDACNGDSGGPLVCNGKLTGIVSFGIGCAVPNYPGVYTNVSYHSKWIKSLTGGSGFIQISTVLITVTISFYSLFFLI